MKSSEATTWGLGAATFARSKTRNATTIVPDQTPPQSGTSAASSRENHPDPERANRISSNMISVTCEAGMSCGPKERRSRGGRHHDEAQRRAAAQTVGGTTNVGASGQAGRPTTAHPARPRRNLTSGTTLQGDKVDGKRERIADRHQVAGRAAQPQGSGENDGQANKRRRRLRSKFPWTAGPWQEQSIRSAAANSGAALAMTRVLATVVALIAEMKKLTLAA